MGGSSSSGGRAVGGRRINPNNRDATQATLAAGRRIGSATGARSANAAERQALANAGVRITDRGFTTRDGRTFNNPARALAASNFNEGGTRRRRRRGTDEYTGLG
jgi:hypothetical protein